MNILVTLNRNYVTQLIIMLRSLLKSNKGTLFNLYIIHSSLTTEDFERINREEGFENISLIDIHIDKRPLGDAPITERYPEEMYYRLLAPMYLPKDMDRILYLDPDIVVINSLEKLYNCSFDGNLFVAASHTESYLNRTNNSDLASEEEKKYINSGVMLMNLKLLREELNVQELLNYIKANREHLWLPDQDIISGVYGKRIKLVDATKYNLSERLLVFINIHPQSEVITLDWIRKNTSIIHYCGDNKPWEDNYIGQLDVFYKEN
ncbi:glycosyltransferase family 8 protein [Alloiococcus sp. CFN-8]|uniref:glycosyltransferase family 8 protein n=1 Tax=Alloiococcus sp. CFN-8 TaxID=3416081 RepID=UPI003CED8A43